MGGTDDASNLMEVTIEEHAELHLSLYLTHGCWQDWVAYNAIAGKIGLEEITREKSRQGGFHPASHTKEANLKRSKTQKGRPHSVAHVAAKIKGAEGLRRLTKEDVEVIKRRRSNGETYDKLAADYKTSRMTICRYLRGEPKWLHTR